MVPQEKDQKRFAMHKWLPDNGLNIRAEILRLNRECKYLDGKARGV